MGAIRCQYCHAYIEESAYAAHEAEHLQPRPDGQQSEYVTLPPEQHNQGDLAGVPMVYVHLACGAATGMPEEIVRSYLQNPYLYLADRTFCTGCGIHVPLCECKWTETGEDLQTYTDQLRTEKPELRPGFFKRLLIGVLKLFN